MSRTAIPYLEQVRGALFWHLEWKTLDNQFMDGGKTCNDRRQREQFTYKRTTIVLVNIRYRHNNQIPIMILSGDHFWLNDPTGWIKLRQNKFLHLILCLKKWSRTGQVQFEGGQKNGLWKNMCYPSNLWIFDVELRQNGRDGCCDTNWRSYMSGGQPSLKWFCSRKCTMKDSCIF